MMTMRLGDQARWARAPGGDDDEGDDDDRFPAGLRAGPVHFTAAQTAASVVRRAGGAIDRRQAMAMIGEGAATGRQATRSGGDDDDGPGQMMMDPGGFELADCR